LDEQQKQTILDLPKVIAVGIASPVATLLTSRFGIAGTLIGLAVGAVVITVIVDILKVYLARVPGAVTTIPGGFKKRSSLQNILEKIRLPFSKFSSLKPARRRSILIGSIAAAGISFFIGLSAVTALEVGVGKSLSCWVWDDCAAGSSTDDGGTSVTGTLPSILGGGQSVSSGASKVQPPSPQQPTPEAPGSPSQPQGVPSSERPSSPQPGERLSPSGAPQEGPEPQSSSSEVSKEDEQRSPVDESEGGDQQPSWSVRSEEHEWRSPAEEAQEDERLSPDDGSQGDQQQEDQKNQPPFGSY
jgi:hypothetical protein